jgi:hypothetical protein
MLVAVLSVCLSVVCHSDTMGQATIRYVLNEVQAGRMTISTAEEHIDNTLIAKECVLIAKKAIRKESE